MNKIRFLGEYVKLNGQRKAKLLDVLSVHINESECHSELLKYDTLRTDGSRYNITDGSYLLLFFLGDKGMLFTTIRRWTYEQMLYYKERIGKMFDIVIIPDNHKKLVEAEK